MSKAQKHTFISNAFKLMTATSFAQILGVLVTPILTRIYAPEIFGLLQIYISIVALSVHLSTCNYEVAILIPDDEKDAKSILWATLFLVTIFSTFCLLFLFFPVDSLLEIINAQKLGPYIYFIPLSIFCLGSFNALSFWLTRLENFGLIAFCRGTQAVVNQVTKLLLGINTGGAFYAFLSGNIVSDIVLLLIVLLRSFRRAFSIEKGEQILKRIKYNLIKYYRFPLFSMPAKFVYQAAAELPALLLAYFFSPTILGFYALGHKLLWMPMEIISKAISRVLIQQVASNKNQKEKMRKLGIRVFESLSVLSIFPMSAIGLTAPEVFFFAFGEQWHQAGVFASLLCFWGICGFIFPPFFEITSIFNKQHVFLIYNIISFFIRFLALVIGGAIFRSSTMAVGLLSISMGSLATCLGFVVLRYIDIPFYIVFQILWRHLISAIIGLLPIILAKFFDMPRNVVIISFPISCIFYIIILKYRENKLFCEMLELVKLRRFSH